jgi:predicted  nucleic acid-binding Zn-ribbon protein
MPHQCVRCNKFYEDGSVEIIQGCSCGAKLFFYIRKEKLEKLKEVKEQLVQLSEPEKVKIEKDVRHIMGRDEEDNEPVVLDLESIHVKEPGKFDLDLVNLFNTDNPIVFKLGDGKYVIDLPETFRRRSGK